LSRLPRAGCDGMTMKLFEESQDLVIPVVLSGIAAILAAIAGFVMTIFIGAKLFSGEMSYGISLLFCLPVALVSGVAVFITIFRKLR
jgi:hypothetical protein